MTDLTDDQVRALLDGARAKLLAPTKALKDAAPDLATALLNARAELARVKADAAAAQALVGTLTGAAQRLNAACDAMWNDRRRVEAHRIKECHMKAISEAQQALFPALEAAENASLKVREEGVAMALKEFRATFCHASPGSDTEFALFLEGFDAAADIARAALANPHRPRRRLDMERASGLDRTGRQAC